MTRHERQIPRGGKAVGRTLFRRGRVLPAMKFSYTPKKGTFKGSFKVYAFEGAGKATKLKKYTVKVSGVVVDGVGHGVATCRNPAASWAVKVE